MKIFDEKNNVIENPDMELGKLVQESSPITFRYIVTQHEQGHYETIAEYPNGGKDIEWVIEVPEEGSWIACDEDNNEVETDIVIPEDMPHEIDIPTANEFMRYVLYTAEELDEIVEAKLKQEEEAKKAEEREAMLTELPERLNSAEKSVKETQKAIAELNTLASDNSTSIEDVMSAISEITKNTEDIMDAIAELGTLVVVE